MTKHIGVDQSKGAVLATNALCIVRFTYGILDCLRKYPEQTDLHILLRLALTLAATKALQALVRSIWHRAEEDICGGIPN
jgi:hypothetical protein